MLKAFVTFTWKSRDGERQSFPTCWLTLQPGLDQIQAFTRNSFCISHVIGNNPTAWVSKEARIRNRTWALHYECGYPKICMNQFIKCPPGHFVLRSPGSSHCCRWASLKVFESWQVEPSWVDSHLSHEKELARAVICSFSLTHSFFTVPTSTMLQSSTKSSTESPPMGIINPFKLLNLWCLSTITENRLNQYLRYNTLF